MENNKSAEDIIYEALYAKGYDLYQATDILLKAYAEFQKKQEELAALKAEYDSKIN